MKNTILGFNPHIPFTCAERGGDKKWRSYVTGLSKQELLLSRTEKHELLPGDPDIVYGVIADPTELIEYLDILIVSPKIFFFELEHVTLEKEKEAKAFSLDNFNLTVKRLNLLSLGIPHNREKIYIIGFRKDIPEIDVTLPELSIIGIKHILENNPSKKYTLSDKMNSYVTKGCEQHINPSTLKRIKKDMNRMHKANVDNYFRGTPTENVRRLTPIETLRAVGVDLRAVNLEKISDTKIYHIVGSCIPPILSLTLIEKFDEHLSISSNEKVQPRKPKTLSSEAKMENPRKEPPYLMTSIGEVLIDNILVFKPFYKDDKYFYTKIGNTPFNIEREGCEVAIYKNTQYAVIKDDSEVTYPSIKAFKEANMGWLATRDGINGKVFNLIKKKL